MNDPTLLAHATEFQFRPDFGNVNDQFSDDPEHHYAVTVAWRGDDRWAILLYAKRCWSTAENGWVYESIPSERSDKFKAATRFGRDEAVALVPGILKRIEAEMIPMLTAQVAARTLR